MFVYLFSFLLKKDDISPWVCILPFAVIIPFQARISYARLIHAKMEAYILVFHEHEFCFLEREVKELQGIGGKVIAIIVNYELTLLSLVVDIIFVLVKHRILKECLYGIDSLFIVLSTIIVFMLATYTFSYATWVKKLRKEYDNYK